MRLYQRLETYTNVVPTSIDIFEAISGFNEEDITVNSLGSGHTDNAKRVVFSGLTGATPAYTGSTNYQEQQIQQ